MEYLINYGLFFLKIVTFVVAMLILFAGIFAMSGKGKKEKGKLTIKKLNKKYQGIAAEMHQETLDKKQFKQWKKQLKQKTKQAEKNGEKRKRIFVVHFDGDIKASAVEYLRKEISAILTTATPEDEVLLVLESPGGQVHGYGLCASQLTRLRDKEIPFTVAIDKVAASGGYLMACVANRIIAAPFAIVGSIGVVAQLPNFHRFLKHNHIDFEQHTAGEYKRTITLFGENDKKSRAKFQEELEEIHHLFKQHIIQYRPQLDIDKVATGEHWLAIKGKELNLVDELSTSDDYLQQAFEYADLYQVKFQHKKNLSEKLSGGLNTLVNNCWDSWVQRKDETTYV